jgi:hypothetical protein
MVVAGAKSSMSTAVAISKYRWIGRSRLTPHRIVPELNLIELMPV